MQKIHTFLMFTGQAEEALSLYTSLFQDGEIVSLTRRDSEGAESEEGALQATFRLAGQEFMAFDSPPYHDFGFTPAMSLYVHCESEEEVERLFTALSEGGKVLMPLGAYPFATKYGWLEDRFGVSWQLSFAPAAQGL